MFLVKKPPKSRMHRSSKRFETPVPWETIMVFDGQEEFLGAVFCSAEARRRGGESAVLNQ